MSYDMRRGSTQEIASGYMCCMYRGKVGRGCCQDCALRAPSVSRPVCPDLFLCRSPPRPRRGPTVQANGHAGSRECPLGWHNWVWPGSQAVPAGQAALGSPSRRMEKRATRARSSRSVQVGSSAGHSPLCLPSTANASFSAQLMMEAPCHCLQPQRHSSCVRPA